jgi:hypothetical protein
MARLIAVLRDVLEGIGRPTASCCSGDPIAAMHHATEVHRAMHQATDVHRAMHQATDVHRAMHHAADGPGDNGPAANGTAANGHRVRPRSRRTIALTLIVLLGFAGLALAQRRFLFWGEDSRDPVVKNEPYDGRFTFARLKYRTAPGGYWYQGLPSWVHGYPMSEDNLTRIMNEITFLGARTDAFNVFTLDDPELTKYPLAYITEPGWWTMNESEMAAFRAYLLKGGFVIFDDFKVENDFGPGGGWDPFEENIKRVFPGARLMPMEPSHPIFHSFFEIKTLADFPQAYNYGPPVFRALFEDNDPKKRVMAIINYNTDISQYWEWSGRGLRPFDETNEAYKLGVNYIIYGLTH